MLTNVKHYVKNYDTCVVRDNAPSSRQFYAVSLVCAVQTTLPVSTSTTFQELACSAAISAVDAGELDEQVVK
jgi:hypothetical protein